jgi:hypothetical protein
VSLQEAYHSGDGDYGGSARMRVVGAPLVVVSWRVAEVRRGYFLMRICFAEVNAEISLSHHKSTSFLSH